MRLACLFFVTSVVPAFAQQPTPSQGVAQMLGGQLGLCFANNATLQEQLATAQAEIKALKDKYEPKKPEEKK